MPMILSPSNTFPARWTVRIGRESCASILIWILATSLVWNLAGNHSRSLVSGLGSFLDSPLAETLASSLRTPPGSIAGL